MEIELSWITLIVLLIIVFGISFFFSYRFFWLKDIFKERIYVCRRIASEKAYNKCKYLENDPLSHSMGIILVAGSYFSNSIKAFYSFRKTYWMVWVWDKKGMIKNMEAYIKINIAIQEYNINVNNYA